MLEVHFNNPQMEKGNYYNFLGIDSIYRAQYLILLDHITNQIVTNRYR